MACLDAWGGMRCERGDDTGCGRPCAALACSRRPGARPPCTCSRRGAAAAARAGRRSAATPWRGDHRQLWCAKPAPMTQRRASRQRPGYCHPHQARDFGAPAPGGRRRTSSPAGAPVHRRACRRGAAAPTLAIAGKLAVLRRRGELGRAAGTGPVSVAVRVRRGGDVDRLARPADAAERQPRRRPRSATGRRTAVVRAGGHGRRGGGDRARRGAAPRDIAVDLIDPGDRPEDARRRARRRASRVAPRAEAPAEECAIARAAAAPLVPMPPARVPMPVIRSRAGHGAPTSGR